MKKIIGYLHICQKGEWKRSFDMIFNCIKNYGLYDITSEIRLGIVGDDHNIIEDYRLNNSKFKTIFVGNSELYERPTLLHMRNSCTKDGENTFYWYLHTKGLRHFGTPKENYVIDWINLMLYFNVRKWKDAIEKLETYNTYGINLLGLHFYSGNFWWARSTHISQLPDKIEDYYTAPEDWILRKKEGIYQAFSSTIQGEGHYNQNYPDTKYMTTYDLNNKFPENFYIDTYKLHHFDSNKNTNDKYLEDYFKNKNIRNLNYDRSEILNHFKNKMPLNFDYDFYKNTYKELINYSIEELIINWFTQGIFEKRKYKKYNDIPDDFDIIFYRNNYNDLSNFNDEELITHWINSGKKENRIYKEELLPDDFNLTYYKNSYNDLSHLTDKDIISHWKLYGKKEGRKYKLIDEFDYNFYKNYYSDLNHLNNEELLNHWIKNGEKEGIIYKLNSDYEIPKDFNYIFYRSYYSDLKNMTDKELLIHWNNFGKKEGRLYNKL